MLFERESSASKIKRRQSKTYANALGGGLSNNFTMLFEALSMQLCKSMQVKLVGDLINESDDKLWRMLDKYVEAGREPEDFSDLKSVGVDETFKKKHHDYISMFVVTHK